jgi:hypothetical protein
MGGGHGPPKVRIERDAGGGAGTTVAIWSRGSTVPRERELLVSLTDFRILHTRDVVPVYRAGMRLRRSWPKLPGAVGIWLWSKPLQLRAGSVSLWCEAVDLQRFVRWRAHLQTVRRFRDRGELHASSWRVEHCDAGQIWAEAAARLAAGEPGRAPEAWE